MSQIKVELQEFMGSDRAIAEAAWTSSLTLGGKQKRSDEDVARIVKQLIEQKHATPIESVIFKFWIKLPLQTDRQHMTHRIASHNGMSGRYRTMPNEWLDIPKDVEEILNKISYPYDTHRGLCYIDQYKDFCAEANASYQNLIGDLKGAEKDELITNKELKRVREFFRGILPQNNMTERVTIMNLRSFANYQKLRNSEHAQPEIQQIAQLMLEAVEKANICPIALEALKANGWNI